MRLPILTKSNHNEYYDWHKYYHRVYGETVTEDVDLNSFTWFYHFCPWKPRVWGSGWSDEVDNLPWTFTVDRWLRVSTPEFAAARLGFFVSRPVKKNTFQDGERVEILRVGDIEFGVSWFYLVTGSGLFIHLPNPLRYAVRDKKDVPDTDPLIRNFLERNSLNALILLIKQRRELVLQRPWQYGLCGACSHGLQYSSGRKDVFPVNCSDDNSIYWMCHSTLLLAICRRVHDRVVSTLVDRVVSTLVLLSMFSLLIKYRPTGFRISRTTRK